MLYNTNEEARDHLAFMDAIEKLGEETPCTNYPDAYFEEFLKPGGAYAREIAKSLCASCPLINMCADFGIRYEPYYGLWGGLIPSERRKKRRALIAAGVKLPDLREKD
jgi:hypothetical protein